MFLLFGWGKRTVKELGNTGNKRCGNCSNIRPWKYKKYTTWFTIFFIPIIPYENIYVMECPICRATVKVDEDEATGNDKGTNNIQSEDGMTEVQRNYRKHMEELEKEMKE